MGVLLVAGAALALYFKFSDRFGGSGQDPRGFTVSKEGTYGTASWMGERELKEVLTVEPLAKAEDILLGKRGGKAVCLPVDTRLNRHIAVFGASGTGKSRGVIRPAIFNIIRRGESAIVTDSKGELYADTAELFSSHGYEVKSVQPGKPGARGFLELHGGLAGGYPPGPGAHQRDHRQHQFPASLTISGTTARGTS